MHSAQRGGVDRRGILVALHRPSRMAISFWQLSFLLLLATPVPVAGAQGSSDLNCSDPLLSNSTQCISQTGSQRLTQPALQPGALSTTPSPGEERAPANAPSYSDVEQLSHAAASQRPAQAPEPLTEFQKFVASTTGLILPVYGANLFQAVPSTFAPVDLAPVPANYVIGPGDELRIRIWGQVGLASNVRVGRSGDIYLPQIGQVHVAGLASAELDAHLRQAVGRVYRNFDLTVDIGQIRAIQVYVSGAARRPGVYTVSSLSTLVDTLFSSGGPSVQGSMRSIELRRDGAVVTRFDLYDLLIRGDKTKDAKLQNGDVIFIPPAGPQVAVVGSVRNPAIYELQPQGNLSGLLSDTGGASAVAAEGRISIERIDEHRDRHAMEVAYDEAGLATPLADGDLIRVYSILPRYRKTVTLRGNIANPGRLAWHEGMHVSDLIPDKESLITRNYWWRRAQLGLPVTDFEPIPGFSDLRQPADNYPEALPKAPTQSLLPFGASQSRMQPGVTSSSQGQPAQMGAEQGPYDAQQSSGLSSGPLGLDQASPLSAQQSPGSAPLASEEQASLSQMSVAERRNSVQLAAPEIDWDYALIERLNRETLKAELLPFDLGKLVLQHDSSQDLALEPGDVVTIFSQADINVPVAEQTKLVRLEGEFVHAGVYSVQPSETLRHLVERAGGFTPNAYLYGSEFTRMSTRAVQQARIDEYVQSLSLAVQRNLVSQASSPAAQGAASVALAQGSERELLANLKLIRATGRVVLALRPSSSGIDNLPNLALEDGDRFVVPHIPAVVNVVGAVYDQNSFLFAPQSRAGRYLHMAGGATRDADMGRAFIVRADGEVVTRAMSQCPWGEFNDLRIYPGDTIVVPEKLIKLSPLYGLLNWSQLFSQLALGAASVNVIR